MTIYAKNITPAQRAWLENYELATGFEPMHQDELDTGDMTFYEVYRANLSWYEDHTLENFQRAEKFQCGLTFEDYGMGSL